MGGGSGEEKGGGEGKLEGGGGHRKKAGDETVAGWVSLQALSQVHYD